MYRTNISQSASHHSDVTMKLKHSTSEQHVYVTYVCLINDVKPLGSGVPDDAGSVRRSIISLGVEEPNMEVEPIQVERSKAVHELVESRKQKPDNTVVVGKSSEMSTINVSQTATYLTSTSGEDTDVSDNEDGLDGPKVLKLTKMKWLSESRDDSPDSSQTVSPAQSTTSSNYSMDTDDDELHPSIGEKYLSTILRLDKEHNLFGLSSIAIVGSRQSRKIRKEDYKPVFPQTAIVQVCCRKSCCRKSRTMLPASLRCGNCRRCCLTGSCISCVPQRSLFANECPPACSVPTSRPPCPVKRPPSPCLTFDPSPCAVPCSVGLRIKLNRKFVYEPDDVEITPRASCVLNKPAMARSCHHIPNCVPPSSWCPYIMPCYWPSRPSAPCNHPQQCFHNPPCLPARAPRPCVGPANKCPKPSCAGKDGKGVCANRDCLGKIKEFKAAMEEKYGTSKKSEGEKKK